MSNSICEYTDLVTKAGTGDKNALETLINSFYPNIFRMVYYRTRSRIDAEDLTQDIFIQMMKNINKLKDTGKFKSWLYRIAINRVKDFHRKKIIRDFFGIKDDSEPEQYGGGSPLNDIIQHEFKEQFKRFADSLSKNEREIFLLRFLDDLEIAEIAQTIDKNENTVKTHLYRAIKKFKQKPALIELLKGAMT